MTKHNLGESTKFHIIISVICTFFILSPVWWHTTRVFQNPLPHHVITTLPTNFVPKFKINVYTSDMNQERFPGRIPLEYHHIHFSYKTMDMATLTQFFEAQKFKGREFFGTNFLEMDEVSHEDPEMNQFSVYFIKSSKKQMIIGIHRRVYVGITSYHDFYPTIHEIVRLLSLENQKDNKTRFPASPRFDLEFNLMHMDPFSSNLKWDVEKAILENFEKTIQFLKPITSLHVSSRVVYFGKFPGDVKKSPDGFKISQQNIGKLLTHNDWKFTEEKYPKIYFNLIVPGIQQSPLAIEGTKLNSFVLPKWGGISIKNVNHSADLVLNAKDLEQSFQIFLSHLRIFLGLSQRSSKLFGFDAVWLKSDLGLSQWEMDGLIRLYVAEYVEKSVQTLKALLQVSRELNNVPITEIVTEYALNSALAVNQTLEFLANAKWMDAIKSSTIAFEQSEKSFFDSSMLSQLYISDYQKMAIYLPLFLPFGITVFMALVRKIKGSK